MTEVGTETAGWRDNYDGERKEKTEKRPRGKGDQQEEQGKGEGPHTETGQRGGSRGQRAPLTWFDVSYLFHPPPAPSRPNSSLPFSLSSHVLLYLLLPISLIRLRLPFTVPAFPGRGVSGARPWDHCCRSRQDTIHSGKVQKPGPAASLPPKVSESWTPAS